MTDSSPSSDVHHESEHDDVENDAVIGAAFRKSLIGLMLLGVPVIGFLVYLNLKREDVQENEVEVIAPDVRVEEESVPKLPLTDVTGQSGIEFKHETGGYGDKLLPETMGGGVVVFDYNNDGHQDILLLNSTDWPWRKGEPGAASTTSRLFAGDGKFHFEDVTAKAGLDVEIYAMGGAAADYDNDGDADLFVSAVGKNRMFRNDDGKFVDVTDESGTSGRESDWGTSCGFIDYDNDGLLDLFVCNYVDWSKEKDLSQDFTLNGETRSYGRPKAFGGAFSTLYHNDGDGKFTDVSATAGIQVRNEVTDVPLGKAMGLAPIDVDNDGWIDLVVANDTVRNFLFKNNQDGTFTEQGRLVGIAYDRSGVARGAMGVDTTVFRTNGTIAIGIGNFANEQSALFMASPKRSQFIDGAIATGLGPPTRQGLTFGFFFFDVDLDGRPDVLGANGHLDEEIAETQRSQQYAQSPQLFWNAGRDSSSELVEIDEEHAGESFFEPIVGRGASYGDFDGDGDQDIVISVCGGSPKLIRNDQELGHHWLRVRLEGTTCNRDAIGAKVTVTAGGVSLTQQLMPTRSYLSQSERVLTFGLGATEKVDEIVVKWPGGTETKHTVDGVDQAITIRQ